MSAVCPECWQRKCINCTELALSSEGGLTDCDCHLAAHIRCSHCNEPVVENGCDGDLNHCLDCREPCTVCRPAGDDDDWIDPREAAIE